MRRKNSLPTKRRRINGEHIATGDIIVGGPYAGRRVIKRVALQDGVNVTLSGQPRPGQYNPIAAKEKITVDRPGYRIDHTRDGLRSKRKVRKLRRKSPDRGAGVYPDGR